MSNPNQTLDQWIKDVYETGKVHPEILQKYSIAVNLDDPEDRQWLVEFYPEALSECLDIYHWPQIKQFVETGDLPDAA